jgi:hypothetical protein
MTLNERLFEAGLIEEFEAAVRARDRERIVAVLVKVKLAPDEAARTTDRLLANPKYYGF